MQLGSFRALIALAMALSAYPQVIGSGGGAPGRQYPPGRRPDDGLSTPRSGKSNAPAAAADFKADGQVVSVKETELVAVTDDGRLLTLKVTPRTIWQVEERPASVSDVKPGVVVHLEALEDGESFLTATTVNVTAEKKLSVRAPVSATTSASGPAPARQQPAETANDQPRDPTALGAPPDDPDRPRLRRGKPSVAVQGEEASAPPSRPASATAKPAPKKTDGATEFTIDDTSAPQRLSTGVPTLIAQTIDWVGSFTNGLPNYLCQQITTRYAQESKSDAWQPVDVISAKVIYENGGESYKDISLGGKKTNKSMLELGGSTSTGEFAATLRDVFNPATNAQFQFSKTAQIGPTTVSVYHFNVELPNSHWSIKVGGQLLRPAYSGEIWINKSNSEVRKIEMQADNVPATFPLRSVYTSVAYDPVRLGTSNFLLPVVAVNQSCERKSTACSKNDIEWRDYHRYSGESTISYQ